MLQVHMPVINGLALLGRHRRRNSSQLGLHRLAVLADCLPRRWLLAEAVVVPVLLAIQMVGAALALALVVHRRRAWLVPALAQAASSAVTFSLVAPASSLLPALSMGAATARSAQRHGS